MRVFLTGGTGFVGQSLTRRLLEKGWQVTALVRNPDSPQARRLSGMGAACVPGDVTDRESMRGGMTGAELVIHNAGWYELGISPAMHPQMYAINVTGTENVLGLALELDIPRTVYVSSCVYYGDSGPEVRDESYQRQAPPPHFYEQSKAEAHERALAIGQSGLPLVVVCPNIIVGPNDHSQWGYYLRLYINRLMPPLAFSPEMGMSPLHVDDVAEGIVLAGEKGRIGETYILAGDPICLRDIMNIWNTKPGALKMRAYLPIWLAKLLFAPMEPLQRMAGLPAFISREVVVGSTINYLYSSAKAQRELGWRYRPSEVLWDDTVAGEMALLARRTKRDLVSRLKPVA